MTKLQITPQSTTQTTPRTGDATIGATKIGVPTTRAARGGKGADGKRIDGKSVDGKYATSQRATSKKPARNKIATPWGRATLVERVSVPQRAGERRFASVVELLESDEGERLVRIAYSTGDVVRRGPVTLRLRDLARLRETMRRVPELADAFGWDGGA